MRPERALLAALLSLTFLPGHAQSPADALTQSGPAAAEEPPHPEAAHEWWFFTVQSPGDSACGPWQAMVSFVADREAVNDRLLLTAVVDGRPVAASPEFDPGTMSRTQGAGGVTTVRLGESLAEGGHPRWRVAARSGAVALDLTLDAGRAPLWHRRAPEGWGVLEITFSIRATASGSLRVGKRVCRTAGATGYAEHVWGTWSRVPMWGVDYLNAHLAQGWSVYARHTPMRGEGNLYPAIGQDSKETWRPAMIVFDGRRMVEAASVSFATTEADTPHPDLGVPPPRSYAVVGTGFPSASGITRATLAVSAPSLAAILFETTSSGILEGWGPATLVIEGRRPRRLAGTAEIEFQRFGTRYPH